MKKPFVVVSKTNTSPKWLHKCRGIFIPRTLSLFAGATTAAISGFILVSPVSHTDLIKDLMKKNDSKITHLSSNLREIEPAPTMVIVGDSDNKARTAQNNPTNVKGKMDCKTIEARYAQAYEAENRRHLQQLNDKKISVNVSEENQKHEAKLKELQTQSLSECRE